jgi:hypothetical protein
VVEENRTQPNATDSSRLVGAGGGLT